MKIRFLWIVVLFLSFAYLHTAKAQDALAVGERVKGAIQIGTGSARKVILLPSGEWEVIRVADSEVRMIDPLEQYRAPTLLDVMLVQRLDRDFAMLMRVLASKELLRIQQWWDDPCKRKDRLYRNPYDSGIREGKCLLVNHISSFMSQGANSFSDVRKWATREKMNTPNTVLQAVLTQFVPQQYLAVTVWVNPALRNLDSHERAWAGSPFHRDYIENDAARQQYAKEFIKWSEGYMTHLSVAFSGQANTAVSVVPAQREIVTFR